MNIHRSFTTVSIRTVTAFALFFSVSVASADTVNCKMIQVLPTTIDRPGKYCLHQNFNVEIREGAAITIRANNVDLDFNGYTISNNPGNDSAKRLMTASGVEVVDSKGVTIKNGRLVLFKVGIDLGGQSGSGGSSHYIENMELRYMTRYGIWVTSDNTVIRKNTISEYFFGGGGSRYTPYFAGVYVGQSPGLGTSHVTIEGNVMPTVYIAVYVTNTSTVSVVDNLLKYGSKIMADEAYYLSAAGQSVFVGRRINNVGFNEALDTVVQRQLWNR